MLDSLLNSISNQVDVMLALAVSGTGFILITWASAFGLKAEPKANYFQYPFFLLIPLMLFVVSYLYSWKIYSALTGFQVEIVSACSHNGGGNRCANPSLYFMKNYEPEVRSFAKYQFNLNVIAIALTAGWYLLNVIFAQRIRES